MTTQIHWTIVLLSKFVDEKNREAFLGDLAELNLNKGKALKSTLGFIARRYSVPQQSWIKPAVSLCMLTFICPLLANGAGALAEEVVPRVLMGWFYGVAFYTGLSPNALLIAFCLKSLAVALWSFSCAFALGRLSPKSGGVSGILFALLSFGCVAHTSWMPTVLLLLIVLLPASAGFLFKGKGSSISIGLLFTLNVLAGLGTVWVSGWNQAAMNNWVAGRQHLDMFQLLQRPDVWRGTLGNFMIPVALSIPVFYLLMSAILTKQSDQLA